MTLPKISIITPSYNQGHYIEETICSVLDQNYPNLEYMIIDGGSKDNTVEIIKKYQKYLTYWVSEKDNGQSDAIIKGYKRCTGEIINWLNSDDYYEPGALKKVGKAFTDPKVNVYCGISRVFGGPKDYFSTGTDIYSENLSKTAGWARIDQPETFFRKTTWDAIGGIDPQFHYLMDRELWIRYLLKFGLTGIEKTKELLVHFRLHQDSKTVSQQKGFIQEGFNYYYSLAKQSNLVTEANILNQFSKCEAIELKDIKPVLPIKSLVHNYFWHLIAEAYAMNDWVKFDYFSQHLDVSQLSKKEKKHYMNLTIRRRFIPKFFKNWWNNTNNNSLA